MKTTKTATRRSPAKTKASRAKSPDVIDLVPALIKVKTILVPFDFSETANKALVYAMRMADQFGSKIVLLNVVEPVATPDFAYHPLMWRRTRRRLWRRASWRSSAVGRGFRPACWTA